MRNPINKQMYEEFNLMYNNLCSNNAPGLDIYEISTYISKAYYSFVNQLYESFERNEKARKILLPLLKEDVIAPSNPSNHHITPESRFFQLPNDLMYIVYEAVEILDKEGCLRGKSIDVLPVTHDDFHSVYKNPFRFTNNRALRLDNLSTDKLSEIVVKNANKFKYYIRYIQKPQPIILTSFTPYSDEINPNTGLPLQTYYDRMSELGFKEGDSIDGYSTETICPLDSIYYQDIIRLATTLAYQDYKN